jgi:hypothetical protein
MKETKNNIKKIISFYSNPIILFLFYFCVIFEFLFVVLGKEKRRMFEWVFDVRR